MKGEEKDSGPKRSVWREGGRKGEERQHGRQERKDKRRGKALDNASREVWSSREEEDRSRGKRSQGRMDRARGGAHGGPLGRPWAMVRLALPSSSGFLLDRIW